ncbi:Glycerol-3-phosphate dehydrogenase-like protein [Methylocella silvestris BL2]|uniref:Glycerol-3-phosphate dehydrogenase n=1 Tax=Methylocella silvestris (strain DSM 15510 / CIP 108128 / LMG 27833 / NCIMB 13906 / BL2) TaxID=395965 RepID=B8ES60_METSB|nr:Glycerol-3-phosphate dehydrogenase-like protein [Methylocella silvestris BL2]
MTPEANVDLLIIGGGVNGAGIARDAAGRGFSVLLCERGDLSPAAITTTTSTAVARLGTMGSNEAGSASAPKSIAASVADAASTCMPQAS